MAGTIRCEYLSGNAAATPTPVTEDSTDTAHVLVDKILQQRHEARLQSMHPVLFQPGQDPFGPNTLLTDILKDKEAVTVLVAMRPAHFTGPLPSFVKQHVSCVDVRDPCTLAIGYGRGRVEVRQLPSEPDEEMPPPIVYMTSGGNRVDQVLWDGPDKLVVCKGCAMTFLAVDWKAKTMTDTAWIIQQSTLLRLPNGQIAAGKIHSVWLCKRGTLDCIKHVGQWNELLRASDTVLTPVRSSDMALAPMQVDGKWRVDGLARTSIGGVVNLMPTASQREHEPWCNIKVLAMAAVPNRPGQWFVAGHSVYVHWIEHNFTDNIRTVKKLRWREPHSKRKVINLHFVTPTLMAMSVTSNIVLLFKFDPEAKSLTQTDRHDGCCVGVDPATCRLFIKEQSHLRIYKVPLGSFKATDRGFTV